MIETSNSELIAAFAGNDAEPSARIDENSRFLLSRGPAVIALRSYPTGLYVTVIPDEPSVSFYNRLRLVASAKSVGLNERFIVEQRKDQTPSDHTWTFRSMYNNRYVASDWNISKSGPMFANRDVVGDWETFLWAGPYVLPGNAIVSQFANWSNFGLASRLSARYDNDHLKGALVSNISIRGAWESFYVEFQETS